MKLFKKRLRQCEAHINKNYDVDGLCKAFPRRIEALIAAGGDRLRNCTGLHRLVIAGTELSGEFQLTSSD